MSEVPKKKMGRPRKPDAATVVVTVMLSADTVRWLDDYVRVNPPGSRSAMIRVFVEQAQRKSERLRKKYGDIVPIGAKDEE
jgi:hypothetical protein